MGAAQAGGRRLDPGHVHQTSSCNLVPVYINACFFWQEIPGEVVFDQCLCRCESIFGKVQLPVWFRLRRVRDKEM